METPHAVERSDGFPVTIEIKSSRNLYGCLRMEAGGVATLRQKDRNAKADKITKIWMGRQDRPRALEALHKNRCLTRVSRITNVLRATLGVLEEHVTIGQVE